MGSLTWSPISFALSEGITASAHQAAGLRLAIDALVLEFVRASYLRLLASTFYRLVPKRAGIDLAPVGAGLSSSLNSYPKGT
jgi:hypothetical protein